MVSGASQELADVFGNHDGAVLSSSAAKSNRQITLAFVDVVGDQIDEQVGDARDEFTSLGKRPNVASDARIPAGERPELGNEVRVGEEANVEDQVGIFGNSFAETEADTGNEKTLFRRLLLKTLRDVSAQFVNVELRSVDHEIGQAADTAEMAALFFERGFHRAVG